MEAGSNHRSQVTMLENLPERHLSPPGPERFSPESETEALLRQLEHQQTKLKLVLDLTNSVLSNLELKELIRNISPSIRQVMDRDAVGLSLPAPDGKHLEVHALDFPDGKGLLRPGELLPLESLPGQVFLSRKPWVGNTNDIATYPARHLAVEEGLMTHCSLPLMRRNRVLGGLCVARL